MVGVVQEFGRNHLDQLVFDHAHVLAGCQAGAVGDAKDVGVHGHGGFAERGVEHHVGGLAAHAR